ncbi:MAG: cupin domain-containing protein [Tsuneonella suprasediminis]
MTQNSSATSPQGRVLESTGSAQFSGINASILMGGENAPFTVMDMNVAPGMGAPAHISFHEDKLFHISEGTFLFLIGDDRVEACAGDHVYVAKGQVHGFSACGNTDARMTLVSTPAHHDRFFRALSDLPVPHAAEDVEAVCKACDQKIVGPVVLA